MNTMAVAVGVLQRADGRVLVAHRDAARHEGGKLEFPGGKVEPDESAQQALARELVEEIGVRPNASEPLLRLRHDYADRAVELIVFRVSDWDGEPHGAEGQPLEWLAPAELAIERFPAANRPIIAALRLPSLYLITPEPADGSGRARHAIAEGVRRAIEGGIRLIQLRAPRLDAAAWHALVAAVADRTAAAPDCRLLVNAPAAAVPDLPAGVGLHLSAAATRALRGRPLGPERLLGCSCHDERELAAADFANADLAVLGPVGSTPTHPDAAGMGWTRFADHAAKTTLPLYALGGVGPQDLDRARAAGAVGIAGIRALWPA
jgi:8-oxo-dGTP diphosphatase